MSSSVHWMPSRAPGQARAQPRKQADRLTGLMPARDVTLRPWPGAVASGLTKSSPPPSAALIVASHYSQASGYFCMSI